jgi:hypothetical protein
LKQTHEKFNLESLGASSDNLKEIDLVIKDVIDKLAHYVRGHLLYVSSHEPPLIFKDAN